jgi:hypothetical protein
MFIVAGLSAHALPDGTVVNFILAMTGFYTARLLLRLNHSIIFLLLSVGGHAFIFTILVQAIRNILNKNTS